MMFFRRGGARLSAAVEQAFISPSGLFQVHVKANGLEGDVMCTLRNKNALQRARVFRVPSGSRGKPHEDSCAVKKWDTSASSRFITATSGQLAWVAAACVSLNLHDRRRCCGDGNVRRRGVQSDRFLNSRSQNSKVWAPETVLFTGGGGEVCAPRCPTVIMHIREASTAAAEPKRQPDADEPSGTADKGEEPVVKEPSPPSSSFSSPSTSSSKAPEELEPEEVNPSKTQQLKKVFKEYGAVGVGFHVSISLMSLGMFYLLVSSGIDMAAVLCKLGFSEAMVQSKMAAGTSTFVLAYAVHKLFAPVRISITLVSVPLIVRYFRKTGLFKPPTP